MLPPSSSSESDAASLSRVLLLRVLTARQGVDAADREVRALLHPLALDGPGLDLLREEAVHQRHARHRLAERLLDAGLPLDVGLLGRGRLGVGLVLGGVVEPRHGLRRLLHARGDDLGAAARKGSVIGGDEASHSAREDFEKYWAK